MNKRQSGNQTMGEVLAAFVDQNKLQKGLDSVAVKQVWEEIMGPAITGYTTDVRLQRNTLYVRLSSSVLREELGYGLQKIIKNLNGALEKDLIHKLVLT